MSELSEGVKREVQQLKNFVTAGKEIKSASYKPGSLQKGVLRGLLSIMPGEVRAASILESPERMAVVDAIGHYQVGLNDRIDFEGAGRTDIADITQEARQREEKGKLKLAQSLENLPEVEREQIKESIDRASKEVEVVEAWIRQRRDTGFVTFQDVDYYRNIVNAISNVAITSIILGPEQIRNRYMRKIDPSQITLDVINDRYSWVFGNEPRNEAERAVMIMHNMGMAAQIIDDWQGLHIDELLNIPTYATEILKTTKGDKKASKAMLDKKRAEFEAKARALGIGVIAAKGSQTVFSFMEKANKLATKSAHKHSGWFREQVEKRHPHLRELSYIRGKLDPIQSG